MSQEFEVGTRVRVVAGSRAPAGSPGDLGTVEWVSYDWAAGRQVLFYHVRLDGQGNHLTMFYPGEVEAGPWRVREGPLYCPGTRTRARGSLEAGGRGGRSVEGADAPPAPEAGGASLRDIRRTARTRTAIKAANAATMTPPGIWPERPSGPDLLARLAGEAFG